MTTVEVGSKAALPAVVEESESNKRQKTTTTPLGVRFGYTILYVDDVEKSISFYETAFGLSRGYVSDDKAYGDLVTGTTKLGFVEKKFAAGMSAPFEEASLSKPAPAFEIAFVSGDVEGLLAHAIESGGTLVKKPEANPWGQTVCYIKDLNGFLVEICSPMDD